MRKKRYRLADLPTELSERIVVNPLTGCWEWQHHEAPDPWEYGIIRWDHATMGVHRLVYALLAGPIPEDHFLDHVYARGCRAKSCCWPAHLEPVPPAVNTRRAKRANIIRGIAPTVLRRIGLGCPDDGDRPLMDAAWMLPFAVHPPRPAAPVRQPVAASAAAVPVAEPEDQAAELENPSRMTPAELAYYFHTTEKAIAGWRQRGYGPLWHDEDGEVVYPVGAVETWIDEQVVLTKRKWQERAAAREAKKAAALAADPAA